MALTNRTLILFKYFWEATDEAHPVSLADISAQLKEHGITADPRTLRSDIEQLVEFGVDIVKRDPNDPKKWVIDEEAAQVVKWIFTLCMEGKGPSQIAALLEKEKVLNPTAYKQREGRKTPHQTPENEYRWHESTVAYILEYMEYTGCTVNFKTYTNSIWDKKQRDNPLEKQAIFPNTHEVIIEEAVFEKVQQVRQQRHRNTRTGRSSIFSGLVYCADCGEKLY